MKKKAKKKLGRPRKIKGVISESEFARVRIAIGLYDEERKNGQKHSTAVSQTVELIKLRYPSTVNWLALLVRDSERN